jgi:hypothetical protein
MINHSNENSLMDDANSPELDKKLLGMVSQDFVKVSDQIKEASYQIRKRGFSDFPIFAMSHVDAEIGVLLIGREELENKWNYRASMLQEFVDRKLIGEESIELFKENYRNPEEFCCLFVIYNDFAGFIFVPYPED